MPLSENKQAPSSNNDIKKEIMFSDYSNANIGMFDNCGILEHHSDEYHDNNNVSGENIAADVEKANKFDIEEAKESENSKMKETKRKVKKARCYNITYPPPPIVPAYSSYKAIISDDIPETKRIFAKDYYKELTGTDLISLDEVSQIEAQMEQDAKNKKVSDHARLL